MKNKLVLTAGSVLSLAVIVLYSLLFLNGISAETGLVANKALLYLTNGLSLALIVFWILAAFFLLDLPSRLTAKRERPAKKEGDPDAKKKEEDLVRPMDRLVLDRLPKHAAAFYIAFLFILIAVSLFLILYTFKDFSAFHLALAVLSVLTVLAYMRVALIHMIESSKTYDAFLLPVPIVFSTLFAIFTYQTIAKAPQISLYYPELMAVMGTILVIYLFTTHFFGDPPRRFHVFAALFSASFCAVAYLTKLVLLFSKFFASEIVSAGDYFSEIASLMLYAAAAILGAVYLMLLLRREGEKAVPDENEAS